MYLIFYQTNLFIYFHLVYMYLAHYVRIIKISKNKTKSPSKISLKNVTENRHVMWLTQIRERIKV